MIAAIKRLLARRRCFHHDHHTGTSWIRENLIDLGRRKQFWCDHCDKIWIF